MPKQSARYYWVVLVLLTALLCACSPASGAGFSATTTAQASRSIERATQMAQQFQATNAVRFTSVTATAEAYRGLLQVVKTWPLMFGDSFDEDRDDWPVGEDEGTLATILWEISEGKYRWTAHAKGGFVWWALPNSNPVSDFYLAADVHQISGPEDAEAGLVLRSDADKTYYQFGINNSREFSVYLHSPAGWESIIDWVSSMDILLEENNRLAVIANGSHLLFFINDRFQAEVEDESLANGEAGLIIGLSSAGEGGYWEFDNFELRTQTGELIEASFISTEEVAP